MPPAPPGAVQPPFQPPVGYYYPPTYLPSTNPAFPSGDPQAAAPPANAVSSAPVPPHGPYPFPLPAPMVDPRHSMPPMQPNLHYPQPAPMPTSAQDASTAPSADPATSAPAGPPYPPQHPAPGGCPGGFPPWPQHPQQMMPYFPYGYPPNAPWTGQVAPPHGYPTPPHGYPTPPHGYPTPPHGYPAPPHVQHPSAMYPPSTTPPAHQQQQPSEQQMTLPQSEPQTTSLPTETHTTPAPSVTQSYVEPTPPSSRTPSINGAPFSETRSTALSPLDQHTSPPSIGTQAPDPYPVVTPSLSNTIHQCQHSHVFRRSQRRHYRRAPSTEEVNSKPMMKIELRTIPSKNSSPH